MMKNYIVFPFKAKQGEIVISMCIWQHSPFTNPQIYLQTKSFSCYSVQIINDIYVKFNETARPKTESKPFICYHCDLKHKTTVWDSLRKLKWAVMCNNFTIHLMSGTGTFRGLLPRL